jgi:spore germination protein GerM
MRKNKEKNESRFIILTVAILFALCLVFISKPLYEKYISEHTVIPPQQEEPQEPQEPEAPVEKTYVDIFFIGHNSANEEVYRAVKREYDENTDGSKIEFALKSLVLGPTSREIAKGVYSEIPSGTRVIYIKTEPAKVIINLTADFEQGGADSLYKRVYQLIKTAKLNSDKPVYLYINGQMTEVLGGDGLMITQPLNENSLGG